MLIICIWGTIFYLPITVSPLISVCPFTALIAKMRAHDIGLGQSEILYRSFGLE